jgi:RNA polymerase sigma-70 factor (ECF subfamily)
MEQLEQYRPRLFAIAYKMTKSVAEAEDIVQDVFLATGRLPLANINNLEGYLAKAVMNRSLSLLEKKQHVFYPGTDLPEPLFQERFPYIQEPDISYALLLLLQKLNPVERAVFLLRETFDYGYNEISAMLELKEDNCRQMMHRIKEKLASDQSRYRPSAEESAALVRTFIQTCTTGDMTQLASYLKENITIYSDGGGKVTAARQPIYGRANCLAFLSHLYDKTAGKLSFSLTTINGAAGIAFYNKLTGAADTIMLFDWDQGQLAALYFVRNTDKLGYCPPLIPSV